MHIFIYIHLYMHIFIAIIIARVIALHEGGEGWGWGPYRVNMCNQNDKDFIYRRIND